MIYEVTWKWLSGVAVRPDIQLPSDNASDVTQRTLQQQHEYCEQLLQDRHQIRVSNTLEVNSSRIILYNKMITFIYRESYVRK